MNRLSQAAAEEMRRLSKSASLRKDMETIAQNRHAVFTKAGVVDVDGYIDFVSQFNEFINHEPKKFAPMIDKDMRL